TLCPYTTRFRPDPGARELRHLDVQGHPVPVRHLADRVGSSRANLRRFALPLYGSDHAGRNHLPPRFLPHVPPYRSIGKAPCLRILTLSPPRARRQEMAPQRFCSRTSKSVSAIMWSSTISTFP